MCANDMCHFRKLVHLRANYFTLKTLVLFEYMIICECIIRFNTVQITITYI